MKYDEGNGVDLFHYCEGLYSSVEKFNTADEEPSLKEKECDSPEKCYEERVGDRLKVNQLDEVCEKKGDNSYEEENDTFNQYWHFRTQVPADVSSNYSSNAIRYMQEANFESI